MGIKTQAGWATLIAVLLLPLASCVPTPGPGSADPMVPASVRQAPTGTMTSAPPSAAPQADAMAATVSSEVRAWRVASPPTIDGQKDRLWETAAPVQLPLTWGMDGAEHAFDMDLRAVYTREAIYFLAQWRGEPPSGEEDTAFNKVTVHWRIPEEQTAERGLRCAVTCHTAFANGQGQFVYANAETIPQGGREALPIAGGWQKETWTLEWSRPLVSANPFDLQLADPDQVYRFFIKVFERVEGRPDPISGAQILVFQP